MKSLWMKNLSRSVGGLIAAMIVALMIGAPSAGQASIPGYSSVDYSGPISEVQGNPSGIKAQSRSARPATKQPLIVGGSETTFEKYPWQVQITRGGQSHCGGTLIHPRIVITAGHCLKDQNGFFFDLQAFTGRTFTGTGGEQLNIKEIYVSNSYQPPALGNDLGFIALSSASSRPQMKIAGADETAVWKVGRVGVATGYGNIVQDGAESPRLREVSMPFIADSFCGGPDVYFTTFQQQVMMCAGDLAGGQSTCQGDSGGPLLARIDGGFRLVGVTSFADGCAKPNRPTVFTRVADPAFSASIATGVKQIEQNENFPGTDSSVSVVGSGGKPYGCTAAFVASTNAAAAVTAAQGKADGAVKNLKKRKKQRNKAAKKFKRSKKAKQKVLKRRTASKSAKKKAVKKFKQARKYKVKTQKKFKGAKKYKAKTAGDLTAAQSADVAASKVAEAACN